MQTNDVELKVAPSRQPAYKGRGDELRRLLSDERRVRLPQFVQFGIVAPKHVFDRAQAALWRYREPRRAADWSDHRLVFDRKDVRPEGGQRLAEDTLYPILASMTLDLPLEFQQRLGSNSVPVRMKRWKPSRPVR